MRRIYLDNAATTAVAPEVKKVMDEVYDQYFGNPSSIHSVGQTAKKIVDDGRRFVSFFVGCAPEEIVFTSGGSESDNLALRGIVENIKYQISNIKNKENVVPHIITSAVEHHAILHTVQDLEKDGIIEATYIKPDSEGVIDPETVLKAVKENTVLVSLIYVNNETGVVTPIRKVGKLIESQNEKRIRQLAEKNLGRIYFHTDAVQAAEFFQIAPEYLKVDLITFTAHKLHGSKGIGALYVKKGIVLHPQVTGGDQEFGMRAGTENVAGIAGFSKALELILHERSESKELNQNKAIPELFTSKEEQRIAKLRDKLIEGIAKRIPDAILNGSKTRRSPNIVNFSFMNAEGESIIINLDFLGIQVSSGSACTARSLEPSHVLSAMDIPPEKSHGSIRFSLSRYTTEEEIDKVLEVLPRIINKLRQMSPFK